MKIELPAVPPMELSANKTRGKNHYALHRLMEGQRAYIFPLARQAVWDNDWKATERAQVKILVTFPTKRGRDIDNITSALKSWIDGLVMAKVVRDDDAQHMSLTVEVNPEKGPAKTVIEVEAI